MSGLSPSTLDDRLQQVFDASVAALQERASQPDASAAVIRAMQLRSFLALAEEHLATVRARLHDVTAPARAMDELSPDELRTAAQWLESALAARAGYQAALGDLLRTMPPPEQQPRPAPTTQRTIPTTMPPAFSTSASRAAAPAHAHRS